MGRVLRPGLCRIDPGNFATNIQAGAQYGPMLLWVIVWANMIAVLVQLLSSKLGLATGLSLAEVLREQLPPWATWVYWLQAEILAIATDLAEFVGAALGFELLFGVTLLQGALLTGVISWAILAIERLGLKPSSSSLAACWCSWRPSTSLSWP